MKKLIVIADWASDTVNCQEVRSAVEGFLKDNTVTPNISFVASTPSTIHTSFITRQIVDIEERYGKPMETVIFQNTDPRIQTKKSVEKAKGAEFIVMRLKSGMYICGPNAGYDFSMIKDKIEEVYHYEGLDKGTQFRSRDLYSRVCAHLMDYMEDELDLNETPSNIIPEVEGYFVVHLDSYGNMKTNIQVSAFKGKFEIGEEVKVKINNVEKKIKFVSNLFGGTPGELVIYPGSSGSKEDPFLEISIWRHFTEEDPTTGVHEFNNPRPGSEIIIL